MTIASGQQPHKNILLLITPSLLSGWFCVAGSGIAAATLIALNHVRNSELLQLVPLWRTELSHYSYVTAFQQATSGDHFQSVTATIFTFLFWAIVGLVLYVAFYVVFDAIYAAREVRQEIHYVHLRRRQFAATMLERAGVRLLALVLLLLGIGVVVKYVIPYLLLAAQHAALTPAAIGEVLLAWCELALALHIGVVLLRLLTLRTRF